MAKLKKLHQNEINALIKNKGLIALLNDHLQQNNLQHLEVQYIRLQPKSYATSPTNLVCGPSQQKVEICSIGGKCEWVCE